MRDREIMRARKQATNQIDRGLVFKQELERMYLKCIQRNTNIDPKTRFYYQLELSRLPERSAHTHVRDTDVYSGLTKSLRKPWRLHRHTFRARANQARLNGVYKISTKERDPCY